MRTRVWAVAFCAFVAAGVADAVTFALSPAWMRAYDLSPVGRALSDVPLVILPVKLAAVAAMACLVPTARRLGWYAEAAVAAATLGGTALWSYGAYTNIVHGIVR